MFYAVKRIGKVREHLKLLSLTCSKPAHFLDTFFRKEKTPEMTTYVILLD